MGKILIVSGYMGSGSSALTGILSEIKGCKNQTGDFEYVFLHCPDGLFDLEDKLLIGNNALRSDEAIHRFINCMKELYDKKHYWVGNYKEKLTHSFMQYVKTFIDDIGTYTIKDDWAHWYFSENPNMWMLLRKQMKKVIEKISFDCFKIQYPRKYTEYYMAFPDERVFYSAAHKFLYTLFEDLDYKSNNLVFDQLVLPHNLFRFEKYFDSDTTVFVVERDPRDVYIGNTYYWLKKNQHVIFPMEINAFCNAYRNMREIEKPFSSSQIIRVRFEDLVYRYDDSLNLIYSVLGISSHDHKRKGELFNPQISINNTQMFRINEKMMECGDYIKKRLGEYIYDFPEIAPYEINHNNIF